MAVGIEPAQEGAYATVCQSNTGIGSPVIEIDRVTVSGHCVATRKDNVLDIAMTLILRLRREHPGIAADQTLIRLLKIEESQT
jgi:hypothetical protein